MLIRYDVDAGISYAVLSEDFSAQTIDVSSLVAVAVDEFGEPVGVEFGVPPDQITEAMIACVARQFPSIANRVGLLTSIELL